MSKYLFTSESVTEGHPDKVCDQISDAVLDEIIKEDPNARVACECFCTTGAIVVMGEITTESYADIPSIARKVVNEIGYDNPSAGFDGHTCGVLTAIDEQSPDIALGVDKSFELKAGDEDELNLHGAGDQGIMFGFATNETEEYMPLTLVLSHKLCKRLADVRKDGTLTWLRPDGKSQVTVEYDDGKPVRVDTVVVSTQHSEDISLEEIRKSVTDLVIKEVIPAGLMDENTKIYINPTGRFTVGGPCGDTGLTGRKIIVDTYGGAAHHGGGCFSGKDPTKVDRSATYAARWAAKNVVAAGFADKCELQLAYAIGVAKPVSIMVNTFGTGKYSDEQIVRAVEKVFDMRPEAIIRALDLRRPIYRQTASYGHFGRTDIDLPWERLDRVEQLKKAIE